MTEVPDEYADTPDDEDAPTTGGSVEGLADDAVRTGDARVDEVLETLGELAERPVAEHAAIFEQAHERLRAALDPDSGLVRESA
jgi:hypothetical protein